MARRQEGAESVDAEKLSAAVAKRRAAGMATDLFMHPQAIIALTESGSTALWMSRMRSDIPIYAFTRHAATQRRVTLYRGVYPVDIDVTQAHALLHGG